MYLVSWIFVGLAVGWFAEILKGNDGYGPTMDTASGVGGAVAGGFIMRFADSGAYPGILATTLVVRIGTVLLTVLAGFVNGRRVVARL